MVRCNSGAATLGPANVAVLLYYTGKVGYYTGKALLKGTGYVASGAISMAGRAYRGTGRKKYGGAATEPSVKEALPPST